MARVWLSGNLVRTKFIPGCSPARAAFCHNSVRTEFVDNFNLPLTYTRAALRRVSAERDGGWVIGGRSQ